MPELCGAAAALVMAVRLFVPSAIGMADNGDGVRLMCQLGFVPEGATTHDELYLRHALLDYVPGQWPDAKGECAGYPSSTVWLMQGVRWLTAILGRGEAIDLRVTMALYCLLVGLVVGLLVRLIGRAPGGSSETWIGRAVAAVALFMVLGDAAFVGYLGSPFTETAGIVGIPVLVLGAVHASLRHRRAGTHAAWIAVFSVAAAFVVAAKVQTITATVPIVGFLVWLIARDMVRRRRSGATGRWLIVPVLGVLLVVASAAHTWRENPRQYAVINPTDMVFAGILKQSPDPAADLAAMGLPEHFAAYAGRSWWSPNPPESDPQFPEIEDRLTYGAIARFLATHPGRTAAVANTGAQDYFRARPDYLGSYQAGAGDPTETECRLCIATALMRSHFYFGLPGLCVLIAAAAMAAIARSRRTRSGGAAQAFAVTALLLNALTVTQFATATFGESIENTKHLVLAVLTGLLTGWCLLASVLTKDAAEPRDSARSERPDGGRFALPE